MSYRIKNISISRLETWQNKDRPLQGKITFEGYKMETSMFLDETRCQKIIDIMADMLVDSAHTLAKTMREEITEIQAIAAPQAPINSDDEIPF